MFEFHWPWAFLLLPLPILVWLRVPAQQTVQQAALRVPMIDDFRFDGVSGGRIERSRSLWWIALILGWLLLVVASARPQWVGDAVQIPVSGRDLMLAVDLSESMKEQDFVIGGRQVDRLSATKQVASEFIRERQGDRLGLILFGRNAYLQAPLTFDLKTVETLLLESVIGLAGRQTAIGDAIGLAIKRLKDSRQDNRILVLLTDGANTAGEITPLKAADIAAENGLTIYTIGIGADEMLRSSIFGVKRVNPSQDLDEDTLTEIAEKTGGRYFRARDTEQLQQIYRQLDELEPVDVEQQTLRPVSELFAWPLGIALVGGLFLVGIRSLRTGGRF